MKINQCQQNYRVTDNKQKNKINVLASPKDRKFARELGVNVNDVTGSERMGRVIEKDIKAFVSSRILKSIGENNKKKEIKIKKEFEHSEFGEIEVKDIPRIKKIAAPHLVNSWTNIPHVTNHDEADITEMEEFRNSLTDIYTGEKKKNYSYSLYYKSSRLFIEKILSYWNCSRYT